MRAKTLTLSSWQTARLETLVRDLIERLKHDGLANHGVTKSHEKLLETLKGGETTEIVEIPILDMWRDISYSNGTRLAYISMLTHVLQGLGRDSKEWAERNWLVERELTINSLRNICAEFGDNEWEDMLHLSDIIEKHLRPYLLEAKEKINV